VRGMLYVSFIVISFVSSFCVVVSLLRLSLLNNGVMRLLLVNGVSEIFFACETYPRPIQREKE
jgi:hypothetical protein